MNVTRKQLIKWGLIAYLSVIVGPPSMGCAIGVVGAFHITDQEKWEAADKGSYRPEKVIAKKLVATVFGSVGMALMLGCPASVVLGLYLAIVALTTAPEPSVPSVPGVPNARRPTANREPVPPPFIIEEPPTPPPLPPRRRS
ncbi:MAG: hypothetical protein ACYC3X_29355 [Pirellulaceae bacterium]